MMAKKLAGGLEILSIATMVDGPLVRLLASAYDGSVVRIEVTDERFSADFATRLSSAIPRTVAFAEDGRDVHVFGMHDACM